MIEKSNILKQQKNVFNIASLIFLYLQINSFSSKVMNCLQVIEIRTQVWFFCMILGLDRMIQSATAILRRVHSFLILLFVWILQVLIPVFALGRAQELCILLESYWDRMNIKVPIYFSLGLTEKVGIIWISKGFMNYPTT